MRQSVESLSQGAVINDVQTQTNHTWSAQKINQAIQKAVNDAKTALKNDLVNGAGSALDTLNELASALNNDPNYANTVATSLSKKLSIEAQTLSSEQQRQVLTNLGMPSDLLAIYNQAKA